MVNCKCDALALLSTSRIILGSDTACSAVVSCPYALDVTRLASRMTDTELDEFDELNLYRSQNNEPRTTFVEYL